MNFKKASVVLGVTVVIAFAAGKGVQEIFKRATQEEKLSFVAGLVMAAGVAGTVSEAMKPWYMEDDNAPKP